MSLYSETETCILLRLSFFPSVGRGTATTKTKTVLLSLQSSSVHINGESLAAVFPEPGFAEVNKLLCALTNGFFKQLLRNKTKLPGDEWGKEAVVSGWRLGCFWVGTVRPHGPSVCICMTPHLSIHTQTHTQSHTHSRTQLTK